MCTAHWTQLRKQGAHACCDCWSSRSYGPESRSLEIPTERLHFSVPPRTTMFDRACTHNWHAASLTRSFFTSLSTDSSVSRQLRNFPCRVGMNARLPPHIAHNRNRCGRIVQQQQHTVMAPHAVIIPMSCDPTTLDAELRTPCASPHRALRAVSLTSQHAKCTLRRDRCPLPVSRVTRHALSSRRFQRKRLALLAVKLSTSVCASRGNAVRRSSARRLASMRCASDVWHARCQRRRGQIIAAA